MLKPRSVKKDSTPKSIFEAIDAKDLMQLALLLEAGFSANSYVNDTYPVHYALRKRRTECVPLLLQAGADLSLRSKGSQPLHIAADKGLDNAIRYLLKRGANVNDINTKSGMTPLHYAVIKGHVSTVSLLMSNGADPLLTSGRNLPPLEIALSSQNHESFTAMIQGGILKKIDCDHLLQIALQARRIALSYMLTISGQKSWSPLIQLNHFAKPVHLKLMARREQSVSLKLLKDSLYADHPQCGWAVLDSL